MKTAERKKSHEMNPEQMETVAAVAQAFMNQEDWKRVVWIEEHGSLDGFPELADTGGSIVDRNGINRIFFAQKARESNGCISA